MTQKVLIGFMIKCGGLSTKRFLLTHTTPDAGEISTEVSPFFVRFLRTPKRFLPTP